MTGSDDAEVPAVEGGDLGGAMTLGRRNDECVGSAEGEVGVPVDQLCGPRQVGTRRSLDAEPGIGQRLRQLGFRG